MQARSERMMPMMPPRTAAKDNSPAIDSVSLSCWRGQLPALVQGALAKRSRQLRPVE
jgi:hypothetical protein